MRNRLAKVMRFSALVVAGGALSFVVCFSNCGGSSGTRTGTAGTMGSGGATGGGTGSGGATGSGGVTGSGGAAGKNMCTPKPDLTCGPSTSITLPDGHITDLSAT